jgi:anti-sigma-K factor RskA
MMARGHNPSRSDERLAELLADEALEGLTPEQELELEALLAAGHTDEQYTIAHTAAVLQVCLMTPRDFEPMPGHVFERLCAAGQSWAAATASVRKEEPLPFTPAVRKRATRLVLAWGPWLAVAASLLLAVLAWWPAAKADSVAVAQRDPNHFTIQWAAWSPDMKGIKGQVCWSQCKKCGYMKLAGLPANDPSREQYQLWIVDDRGMNQRISGGVFDSTGDEVVMPIHPGILIRDPKMFAVTLEPPGGTWVSDLSRKVAIAQRQ